ncbi:MAG: phosphoribosyl-ATP pyrophosphohydrolase [Asgard group archaeon]|nr:phosphoribosyl-ATP pyrophosphohydrolase [Asgard group archaeon]
MTKKTYNKLVRDNIPDIIEKSGREVDFITITDLNEKLTLLNNKLVEEVQEYNTTKNTEELVDILEVVYTILSLKDISFDTFEKLRTDKKLEKGGFDKGYFLVSVKGE